MTVIFLHIGRTAGTTFHDVLERQYEPLRTFTVSGQDVAGSLAHLRELSDVQKRSIYLVKGHMPFGIHEYLPQRCSYITFIRDPLARAVSSYNQVLKSPTNQFHSEVAGGSVSFVEYMSRGYSKDVDNGQVRALSGMVDVPFRACTEEMLTAAKRNISEHFDAVGVTEFFDESLILMRRTLGWRRQPLYVKRNAAAGPVMVEELSVSERNVVGDLNKLDHMLYRFVTEELFEGGLGRASKSLRRDVRYFRALNRVAVPLSWVRVGQNGLNRRRVRRMWNAPWNDQPTKGSTATPS